VNVLKTGVGLLLGLMGASCLIHIRRVSTLISSELTSPCWSGFGWQSGIGIQGKSLTHNASSWADGALQVCCSTLEVVPWIHAPTHLALRENPWFGLSNRGDAMTWRCDLLRDIISSPFQDLGELNYRPVQWAMTCRPWK
jgi:hypothetical protein